MRLNNELLILKLKDTYEKILFFASIFCISSINAITIENDTQQKQGIICWFASGENIRISLNSNEYVNLENINELEIEQRLPGEQSIWIKKKVNRQTKILTIKNILERNTKSTR